MRPDLVLDRGQGGLYPLFRRCALAVLNSGTMIDDARLIFEAYKEFELRIVRQPWGIKLEMSHAPGSAFVDGEMIRGMKEHVFAVLRVFDENVKEVTFQGALDPRTPIAQGWLRASHRKLDPGLTLPYRPYHTHDERQWLKKDEIVRLDVEIWPTCMVFRSSAWTRPSTAI